jgi:di/tricarboxylate transporter
MKRTGLEDLRLHAGDCLLLAIDSDGIDALEQDSALVLVSRVARTRFRSAQMPVALLVIAGVVAATALNLAPIAVSALGGVLVMTLTGCLKLEEGIQSVNWEVIMLLAGMIPLGLAMEKTGAAAMLAETLIGWLGAWGPHAVLSGLLFVTMMLTAILNNQASAVLLAPMVIEMGHAMSVDPRAFLIAVTYGASLSFITPVGYQTNTMIYGPGQYRFSDFFRVGIGLNILLWIVGSLLIPLAWPFTP